LIVLCCGHDLAQFIAFFSVTSQRPGDSQLYQLIL